MNNIVYSYNDQNFKEIVNNSFSYADCMKKLGYQSISGDSVKILKRRIEELHINIEHFFNNNGSRITRNDENVFCIDSTANQSTLRKFYKNKFPQEKCKICGQGIIWNNKPLNLILDHINGCNTDNRLENLRWVCGNCNSQLDTTNGRNPRRHKYFCLDCGKQISKGAIRCAFCAAKTQQITERPSREELKSLIRTIPFTQIGKQFGVRDNSIKKWCRAMNLPYRKIDINNYTDEEWAQI